MKFVLVVKIGQIEPLAENAAAVVFVISAYVDSGCCRAHKILHSSGLYRSGLRRAGTTDRRKVEDAGAAPEAAAQAIRGLNAP
ncbi:hypothetical protein NFK43_23725 (plasmid) [Escherichia coli]|nr:hypothetical protein [Escherichia coli]WFY81404.1 hypothetical protein NFK43_23725 [Escherichia coli]